MACNLYVWAEDTHGVPLPFDVQFLIRRDGSAHGAGNVPAGSYDTVSCDAGIEYCLQATNQPAGWIKDPDWYCRTNCSSDVTFVYEEVVITDYYVKTTGDDALTGDSWAAAWRTINKAATTVPDGSTVHIGYGNYTAEPPANKIAPQNAGTTGIGYKPETTGGGAGLGSVKIEKN